ncbi:hypothetical protein CERSUDRAFT_98377 [Gelatoporia subvermispora B]|uniref:Protein kinase domain-containing protein n=1 Tax=Ceriporiopsis subvermispora (strain B) TaxID=914234 RepID=M2R6J8_CERS8|nr:hypothetical protein CERSUDRAFT_98377 [Gelatoporia subvermispora B]
MTPEQLGEDPTVATLSGVQRHEWLAKLHANHLPVDEDVHDVPMYEVSLGGIMGINDSERWVTIGTPIWVSLSLFDRGTLVWRVRKKDTLDLKVLKNVWYGGARASAPEAHRLIEGKHPGVACCDGFNVLFPGTASPISTNLLRGNLDPSPSKNRTLYRLLYPPGRSLFEACSELELIRGMRAALRGHEFLCSQSILHRDIGVDNILLSCDDELREGAEGFLIDLELAIYTGPTIEYRTLAPIRLPTGRVLNDVQVKHLHWTTSVANRGAPVTGTLQFMAAELLASLDDSLRSTGRPVQYVPVEHQTHHDIESFIWVLLYSLIRRVIVTSRQNLSAEEETWMQSLKMEFKHYYGQRAPDGILAQRSNDRPWKVVVDYPPFFSDAIRELIGQLSDHLEYKRTNPLSHTAVLDVLDIAIRRLSQSE